MNRTLLALYGVKWDPFSADVPASALFRTRHAEFFCTRVEHLLETGGFAVIMGDPGTGKSVTLRLLADRLGALRDVTVGVLSRPQSGLGDFYRELGHLFGVALVPHNRWAQFKALRERWLAHVDSTLTRPVLLVDEAQDACPAVLSELRLLSSIDFDSRSMLTTVLGGDARLANLFRSPDLIPLASRIRVRLALTPASPEELVDFLRHVLDKAGNPQMMTPELMTTLAEHAAGNYRVLTTMASQLLHEAVLRKLDRLDEKLYFDIFSPVPKPSARTSARPVRT